MQVTPGAFLEWKENAILPTLKTTDEKVQKVVYAFFSVASLIIAIALSDLGGVLSLLSIPFYVMTASYAHRYFGVEAYDSKDEIASFCKEARKSTFSQILKKHGLVNLFRWNLLEKEELNAKLKDHLVNRTPEAISSLFIAFKKATSDVSPYRQTFVDVMAVATCDIKPSELFENPFWNLLSESGLLSSDLISSRKDYAECKNNYTSNIKLLKNQFREIFRGGLDSFEPIVKDIQSDNKEAARWIYQIKQDIAELKKHPTPDDVTPEEYLLLQSCNEVWDDIRIVLTTHQKYVTTYQKLRRIYQEAVDKECNRFSYAIEAIDSNYGHY